MKKLFLLVIGVLVFSLAVLQASAEDKWDNPPVQKSYYIKSVPAGDSNAGFLDQPGKNASFKKGANVMVWACDKGRDQRFQFVPAGGGFYYIVSENGGYLDLSGNKNADGVNVIVWTKNGKPNQKFRFKYLENNRWKIYTSGGRVLILGSKKHENGSNLFIYRDVKINPWSEWYFVDTTTNARYSAVSPGISGTLAGVDYDVNNRPSGVKVSDAKIEVWVHDAASKNPYVLKKTVTVDSEGNFDIGTEFDKASSIFLISRSEGRASAYAAVYPLKSRKITGFVSVKFNASNYVLVETKHRGRQYYYKQNGVYYLQSGIVTKQDGFFFPDLKSINRKNPVNAKLLADIKAGAVAGTDEEIRAKMDSVFAFLRTRTKSYMDPKNTEAVKVSDEMFSLSRASSTAPLSRWPKFEEYAGIYSKYGYIPTGNCTSWSNLAATLLYAAGVPADKFFVAKFNYDMSWFVEHWVLAVNIGNRWYSIDPQHASVRSFPDISSFNDPRYNGDRGLFDFKKPFEAYLLPGSKINKVPYLGDPKELDELAAAALSPDLFLKNKKFSYYSETPVSKISGSAAVISIDGPWVVLEVNADVTKSGFKPVKEKFNIEMVYRGNGNYISGEDKPLTGKVNPEGKTIYMTGEKAVPFSLTVK
ncbi:MAG: RICIN domain-containing protein [Spirochaetes bacterium]|nr:RICIN domain-containing protein [Spirochaetota bacterium]